MSSRITSRASWAAGPPQPSWSTTPTSACGAGLHQTEIAARSYHKPKVFKRTNLTASLNFRNLLDQRYFEGTEERRTAIIPGAPLTIIGSLTLEFF